MRHACARALECYKVYGKSPVSLLKAIKNDVQIAGTRKAMERDGAALVRLFKWLEENVASGNYNECDVWEMGKKFRAASDLYRGDSFGMIAGYKEHGAIVHYSASEESASTLHADGLLLVDSGGQYCSPNDHCNCGQSTNDVYPTSIRLALIRMNTHLVGALTGLISAFRYKADEYSDAIKMGRTQLQDAVPMSFGQEFNAYANNLEEEILNLERNVKLLHEINMGGTAIGTGLNAVPGFAKLCAANLSKLTGENFETATDLVEATPDTGAYVSYSSALKRLAVKLSKICNDLRLMASGPRCGLNEINLPPKAPGSSIMPGKVNPVIPEVTNQVCFKVIGNDTTISFAAEAGQLELNVMEPIITESLFESLTWMKNAIETLTSECILGITVNKERCYEMVKNSIGIVTALNPIIGYKKSTKVAKEAHETGRSVYDIVIEQGIMSKEELDKALDPNEMLQSHKFTLK